MYTRVYALHPIEERDRRERALEREPAPERALVRVWNISYLPIKGGRLY